MCVCVCVCVCVCCVCLSVCNDHIYGTVRSSCGGIVMRYVLPVVWTMDDVTFAHKSRLFNVAAQMKRSTHAALGLATEAARSNTSYRPTDARDYVSGA